MLALLLLLPIVSTSAGFLSGHQSPRKPNLSAQPGFLNVKPSATAIPQAALAPKAPAALARSAFVPMLSYGGLATVAVGAGKLVTAAGYAGATVLGMPMPLVTLAAVVAPAAILWAEFRFFGGGERVATMMGGKPADEALTGLVGDVARRAGLQSPAHVFEIPTGELNAFAAGFGQNDATVAVTSGLRQTLNKKELEAVIAHEIGHIRHSDMRTNMHVAVAIAGLGGIYEIGRFIVDSDRGTRRRKSSEDNKNSGSSVTLGLSLMAAGITSRVVAQMLKLSMSRSAEFDADSVAAELCGSDSMISALSKIQAATENRKSQTRQSTWFWSSTKDTQPALSSFRGGIFAHAYISDGKSVDERGKTGFWGRIKEAFSTHPTTQRRIAALQAKRDVRA